MSGDPPTIGLVADAGGMLERLVRGLAIVADSPMPRWALVGGLAVMVQLAEAHRATDDLDSAADNDEGGLDAAIAVLVHSGQARQEEGRLVLANGAVVDVIEVGAIDGDQLPDLDDGNRWFSVSHVWAVDTAERRRLVVFEDGGRPITETAAPIAQPGPLVAMKLQSHRARQRRPEKQASDIYDVYRLLVAHDRDGTIARNLATAPHGLAERCAEGLEETFVTEAARWARHLSVYDRGGDMGRVTADDLEVVGGLAAETLRRLLR